MIYSHWELEKKLWDTGYEFIAGIDEAGRGPWAGPVVSGVACFRKGYDIDLKLRDSKKISENTREDLYSEIIEKCLTWGVGIVEASDIDSLGIAEAVRTSMSLALIDAEKKIDKKFDLLIIDGSNVKDIAGYKAMKINKADSLHCSVSAAAILAKVTRDKMMRTYSNEFPEYGFERNKAYGTKEHKEALLKYGPTSIHRYSYKPVKEIARSWKER